MVQCPICGMRFKPRDSDHIYCSPRCEMVAARQREEATVKTSFAVELRNGESKSRHRLHEVPRVRKASAVRRRFALLNAVVDGGLPRTRTELATWLLLYRHAKPDGVVTLSETDLARRAGCTDRAIRQALKQLQKTGHLERIKRGTLAGGPSQWRLLIPEKS